jgi:predicted Zn-dependent protease
MTENPLTLCADIAAQAGPGEWVEVFARRTRSARTSVARLNPRSTASDQLADGWLVGVRSVLGNDYGVASTNLLEPASLVASLASARGIRRLAPRPWSREPAPVAAGPGPWSCEEPPEICPEAGLASLRRLAQEALQAEDVPTPVVITAGRTHRTVLRCDSAGGRAAYTQSEAQLHVRSASPGLDAAQEARIRPHPDQLPVRQVAAGYSRCLRNLSGAPASVPTVDWLALSPLAVARIVSRLSRGLLRRPGEATRELQQGRQLGSRAVTLIDDGRPDGGPAGSPFDDEGTRRRRNVLLRAGAVETLLGSHESGPTTGNASWAGWNSNVTVATTNCFLEPTCETTAADLLHRPGTGFIAEDVRGFRSGLDLASSRIEFELGGAVMRTGEQLGSGKVSVSSSPDQFLKTFLQVLPGIEFYRITGLYGGSWCVIDGSQARNDR